MQYPSFTLIIQNIIIIKQLNIHLLITYKNNIWKSEAP